MKYIAAPPRIDPSAQLGGKARALAALDRFGFPIPRWFVVLPAAREQSADALSGEVAREVEAALERLCPNGQLVAVRSSASDEDGTQHSFAGQLESYLFVPIDQVARKIVTVWESGFSERIMAYRREHGLAASVMAPAVLVQRMVDAEVSGVAFGADPISGRRGIAVVSAVRGVGAALVSGEVDGDTWHVDRAGGIVFRREIGAAPVLADGRIREVAELARRAGRRFGLPQDIEWAYEAGRLHLLQSRPITSLCTMPDPDGCFNLWDNSNIAESYSGVTTPLTFSFAREIYEEVYRQFCRILRVPEGRIAANRDTFRRMLGLIDGRVYYNLLSWYRVLALLPGYTVNRRFMEQMMGVKEPLPDGALPPAEPADWRARLRDGIDLFSSLCGLIGNHFSLPRNIERFYARLNTALAAPAPSLEEMRPDELAAAYRDLEARLLTRWDAPLVNDFFAMIFYGMSRRLVEKWRPGAPANLQNDLIRGEGGMISAEPGRRVREMAALAAGTPALVETLCVGSPDEILDALATQPGLQKQFDEYLEKFGDRCLEELKLESATLHDDPAPLLRSIGHLAKRGVPKAAGALADAGPAHKELDAMRGHPVRRVILSWVLRHARARVRDRENLRFERTRLFGRVRRIFVEIGRRFHAIGVLDDARDIFYLTVEEALGFIEGTAASKQLRGLARVRAAEFARYREAAPPADRFETRGTVDHGNAYQAHRKTAVDEAAEQMTGIGCCAGVVRGRVRVVRDPRNAMIQFGEVLVAERTDPGWIMLFPSAAGLLVEHGSLLSHSAIVAREMGIPAIVSIAGVTRWLRDGDWVELDGSSGVVRKIAPPE